MSSHPFLLGLAGVEISKAYFGALSAAMADENVEKYFSALILIGINDKACNQRYLSEALSLDKSSVVRIVDYLEDAKLVERCKNEADRRECIVILTERGQEIMPKLLAAYRSIEDKALGFMSQGEKEIFLTQLDKVIYELRSLNRAEMILSLDKVNNNESTEKR